MIPKGRGSGGILLNGREDLSGSTRPLLNLKVLEGGVLKGKKGWNYDMKRDKGGGGGKDFSKQKKGEQALSRQRGEYSFFEKNQRGRVKLAGGGHVLVGEKKRKKLRKEGN